MNFVLSGVILAGVLLKSEFCLVNSNEDRNWSKRETAPYYNYYSQKQQPGNYKPNSYSSCKGNYGSNLFVQPNCKTPRPCLNPLSLPQDIDKSWLGTPRTYYVSLSTCFGYSLFAEILLSRPVRTYQELYEMCPTMFVTGSDDYFRGYGKQFAQTCASNPNTGAQRDCITLQNGTDPDVDTTPMRIDQPTLIATDSKTWALFYRCVNNHFGDFLMLSTRPYIEKSAFSLVLGKLELLGFSGNDIIIIPWPCKSPKYLFPFQNYLRDACPCPF